MTIRNNMDPVLRGTGRTTRQMQEAPAGAVFVWCTSELWYPQDLARRLGREDLEIIRPSQLQPQWFMGRTVKGLVIDHAASLGLSQYEAVDYIRTRIRQDGNSGA